MFSIAVLTAYDRVKEFASEHRAPLVLTLAHRLQIHASHKRYSLPKNGAVNRIAIV
jgi:hypothetical protein